MGGKSLEVIDDTDTRRGAGMESRQSPVFERNFVIEANEFHQHVAD